MDSPAVRATIRRYCDSDEAAVYDVCIRTARAGQGVGGRYSNDDLVPDIVAGPYLLLEPQHAYVLDDGERAVGYIIGTASTQEFVAAYRDRWLPRLRDRYQPLSARPATDEEQRLDAMFHPERLLRPELVPHPAHLHVNLLPAHRRHGHGTALLDAEFAALRTSGAAAVHLGVATANTAAQAFYGRLGFQHIDVPQAGPTTFLGRRLA